MNADEHNDVLVSLSSHEDRINKLERRIEDLDAETLRLRMLLDTAQHVIADLYYQQRHLERSEVCP